MSKIQAIILAGGKGTRLKPYTAVIPKPLMPVGEHPICEVIIRQLESARLKNIVISTGHLAGLIEAYFGDGRKWGVHITYVTEHKPLGTAGALKLIKKMDTDCVVINGDVLTDLNFKELIKHHKLKKAMATITIKERVVKTDFGVIEVDKKGDLSDYIEKPEHKSFVSIGVYVLNKGCWNFIKDDENIGMPDLILRMKAAGEKISCFKTQSIWLDLGRLDDFEASQDIFEKHKKKFLGKSNSTKL
ncbi:MAG: sugar phosphate nucleotidyltransferase [Candidatus Omnitrophota bacterium]